MKLVEVITNIEKVDEESVLYVKRIDGQFTCNSDVTILKLTEVELEWKTFEVTEKKCPGFDYFLETFLIKEIIGNLKKNESIEVKCNRLIHYAEFDA
ncbi:hypothetical protein [Aquimarina sp. 2201CG5-10]|uniref:DUF7716 domain-containing protein n=1 Tax=Aquimarina callyspongiae TaxID=3098150 RepID=UPI002AB3EB49|nr:hypothetical protein [Aquimarina sp. 2201CG5-10]MDY8135410.1 hypothetical protein [Aquimarina sp. 2201CG5-10]